MAGSVPGHCPKRFNFGRAILGKDYFCVPEGEKGRVLYFEPDTPGTLYIRSKPAAYQKITSRPATRRRWTSKGHGRGRQVSIKDVVSITSKPTRGWDADAPTTKVVFV